LVWSGTVTGRGALLLAAASDSDQCSLAGQLLRDGVGCCSSLAGWPPGWSRAALLGRNDRHPATFPSRPRLETRATIRCALSVCASRSVAKQRPSLFITDEVITARGRDAGGLHSRAPEGGREGRGRGGGMQTCAEGRKGDGLMGRWAMSLPRGLLWARDGPCRLVVGARCACDGRVCVLFCPLLPSALTPPLALAHHPHPSPSPITLTLALLATMDCSEPGENISQRIDPPDLRFDTIRQVLVCLPSPLPSTHPAATGGS
jgi:hypothetical protein